jgi:hypothetical protein
VLSDPEVESSSLSHPKFFWFLCFYIPLQLWTLKFFVLCFFAPDLNVIGWSLPVELWEEIIVISCAWLTWRYPWPASWAMGRVGLFSCLLWLLPGQVGQVDEGRSLSGSGRQHTVTMWASTRPFAFLCTCRWCATSLLLRCALQACHGHGPDVEQGANSLKYLQNNHHSKKMCLHYMTASKHCHLHTWPWQHQNATFLLVAYVLFSCVAPRVPYS